MKYKGKIPLTAKQLNTNTHTIRLCSEAKYDSWIFLEYFLVLHTLCG